MKSRNSYIYVTNDNQSIISQSLKIVGLFTEKFVLFSFLSEFKLKFSSHKYQN